MRFKIEIVKWISKKKGKGSLGVTWDEELLCAEIPHSFLGRYLE